MNTPVTVRQRVPIRLAPSPGVEIAAMFVTFSGLASGLEHVAVVAPPVRQGCLVRIHSECLTGDVFASCRCDCGQQLGQSLSRLSVEGGVLLYMRQEGRGIGLYNKLDTYVIQDGGVDTFSANEAIGRGKDERSYEECGSMLVALGLESIRLISNNPLKVAALRSAGLAILELVPTVPTVTPENRRYLEAKVEQANHSIHIEAACRES